MSERLDRVVVAYSRGQIVLPWASRNVLLHEIRRLDSARDISDAFDAVGASRPVTLTSAQAGILVDAINIWSQNVTVDGLPEGVWALRNALVADLHDSRLGSPEE